MGEENQGSNTLSNQSNLGSHAHSQWVTAPSLRVTSSFLNLSLSVSKNGVVAKMTFGAPWSTVSGVCKDLGGVPKPRSDRHRRCHQRAAVLGSGSGRWEPSLGAARVRSGLGPWPRAQGGGGGRVRAGLCWPLSPPPVPRDSSLAASPPPPPPRLRSHLHSTAGEGRSPPARNPGFPLGPP